MLLHDRFPSAHKDVRPPERKFFRLTGGRGSCRAVISASREVGKSAGGKFGGLTVGSVGALSPTVVKLQNSRRPQGATLQKFLQFQTSVHWRVRLLPSRNFGRSGNWRVRMLAEKISAHLEVRPPERKNFSAHKDVRPPESFSSRSFWRLRRAALQLTSIIQHSINA